MPGQLSVNKTALKPDDPAIPCGLVALSFFNDDYKLFGPPNITLIPINSVGIAWQDDLPNF